IINTCVTHVSLWIDTVMASFILNAVSYNIYYADRLNQLPQGVIGTVIGKALLPLVSKQANDIKNKVRIHRIEHLM
ncbi:lipid II flippase MurJ, partial [Wolbachia endosymbiont of Atemnus politus]